MRPTNQKNIKKAAWVAVLTSLALALSVNSAHSRLIDWTSAEFVYTPGSLIQYSSDCLISGGQAIYLSDWQAEELERVVTVAVSRPVAETTVATEIPSETTIP